MQEIVQADESQSNNHNTIMSADMHHRSSKTVPEHAAGSAIVRWLLGLFFLVLALSLIAIFGAALFALRMWSQNRVAQKAVEEEMARLRLAGAPMTVEDLYRFHAIPKHVADSTPTWLAAQKACASSKLNQDGAALPFVGSGNAADLQRGVGDTQLAAAEAFLTKYAPALEAIVSASQQPGECRYPTKFGQGFSMVSTDVQGVRTLVRLLALDVQVKSIRGQTDEALTSLAAMFEASDTISHQLTIVEQLVRLATLGSALAQTEFLLSETLLSDEQLARLAQQVAAFDIQDSFTRGLTGERALGVQDFQRHFGGWRSADCLKYLELMKNAIQFSTEPLPDGRNQMQNLSAQLAKVSMLPAANSHLMTALSLPSLNLAFDAHSKATASQRSILAAIAAQRYRLNTGHLPAQLVDLVPDYLPAIPLDPFDGQPLRFRADEEELLIYSVGIDGKDDGGQDSAAKSTEPDIVCRVSSVKDQSN